MGCTGVCGPKRVWFFLAVLDIKRVSILAVMVLNTVWFLHTRLEFDMLFRRIDATFSAFSITPSTKALHNAFNICLNLLGNYCKAGLKQSIDLSFSS